MSPEFGGQPPPPPPPLAAQQPNGAAARPSLPPSANLLPLPLQKAMEALQTAVSPSKTSGPVAKVGESPFQAKETAGAATADTVLYTCG